MHVVCPCIRVGNKQLKNTKLSNTIDAREASRAEGRSPFLLWLIWIVWLPLITPAFIKLFQAHLPLPQLIATLFGVALFFVIYLLASWRRAVDIVTTSTIRHTDALTWLMIAALTVLGLLLTLLGGSEWQTLFYYTSGFVGGSLLLRRAIPVVFVITLLALSPRHISKAEGECPSTRCTMEEQAVPQARGASRVSHV